MNRKNETKDVTFSIRIPKSTKDALADLAVDQDRSINWLVNAAIKEYLSRNTKKK